MIVSGHDDSNGDLFSGGGDHITVGIVRDTSNRVPMRDSLVGIEGVIGVSNDYVFPPLHSGLAHFCDLCPASSDAIMPTPEAVEIEVVEVQYVYVYEEAEVSGEIVEYICSDRFKWGCATALSIVWDESRGDPRAYNVSGASGLFQIMLPLHAWRFSVGADPFEYTANIRVAYRMYLEQGWEPWL